MTAPDLLRMLALGSAIAGLTYLAVCATGIVAAALRAGGRRADAAPDDALAASRFAVPVTIVIPLTGLHEAVCDTISCALSSAYPELEVIVVADADSKASVGEIAARWNLQPREFFYRQMLAAGAVTHIFRSVSDPRLLLVQKAPGGLADAMNCGVNLGQYRYVMVIEPTTHFGADALMRAMGPALRNPERVAAAAVHVERRRAGGPSDAGGRWSDRFQRLESIRSLMRTRIGHIGEPPSTGDLAVVWRRDAVVERGGFATGAIDPVLDMLLRLRDDAAGRSGPDAASGADIGTRSADVVVTQGDVFGCLAPVSFAESQRRAAAEQAALRQSRATADTGPAYLRWSHGSLASAAVAVVLLGGVASAGSAVAAWSNLLWLVVLLSFGHATLTVAALLVRGAVADAPRGFELVRLTAVSPFEFVLYRAPVVIGRLATLLARKP